MNKIYDHDKLCQHKKMVIPLNIKLGEMMNEILNGINPRLLKSAISSLKKQYSEEHNDILNTEEKKNHVQMVLDKIANGKYNFAKQNIEEGQKFNAFYEQAQIPLPIQERNFNCIYCQERSFKNNASLHSHYKSCKKKTQEKQNLKEIKQECHEGFKIVKKRQTRQTEPKIKKLPVEIIKKEEKDQLKKEEETKQDEDKVKKERPYSTFSFGSDIFYGDE